MGSFLLLLSLFLPCAVVGKVAGGVNRSIRIINESQSKISVYWVHPVTRETVLMTSPDIVAGSEFPLDSYVGHEFEARELPSVKTGLCQHSADQVCRRAVWSLSENEEQVIIISADFEARLTDNKIKAREEAGDLIAACRAKAAELVDTASMLDSLMTCVEGGGAETLEKVRSRELERNR
jgi:hypothetical protein